MRPERVRLFVKLAEDLMEASTLGSVVQQHPGANQLLKNLHSELKLPHDVAWGDLKRIYWSELKDTRNGKWVIIKGTKGTGAIKSQGNGDYVTVGSDGGPVQSKKETKGGRIEEFLTPIIGKPVAMYSGEQGTAVTTKQNQRAANAKPAEGTVLTPDLIVKKFKPLWRKAAVQALADIQGFVQNQIKNGAFEKAESKLSKLKHLRAIIDELDEGDTAPDIIKTAVMSAIILSAGHFYPEQTGEITRGYGSYRGSAGLRAENQEGISLLLTDIREKDPSKMGYILSFFKRSLLA